MITFSTESLDSCERFWLFKLFNDEQQMMFLLPGQIWLVKVLKWVCLFLLLLGNTSHFKCSGRKMDEILAWHVLQLHPLTTDSKKNKMPTSRCFFSWFSGFKKCLWNLKNNHLRAVYIPTTAVKSTFPSKSPRAVRSNFSWGSLIPNVQIEAVMRHFLTLELIHSSDP